jgi:hypothetical protein
MIICSVNSRRYNMPIRGALGRGLLRAGRAVSRNPAARKTGMGLLLGGAAMAGIIAGSKSVIDSAQDVAFNDPEADRKFTGHDFGPGFYASQAVGGPVAAVGRAVSPLGAGARAKSAFMTRDWGYRRNCSWSFRFGGRIWRYAEWAKVLVCSGKK